jgi:hypothetical protein
LGNPPWERIKLEEEEFFAVRDPQIANAANKAARKKLIDALQKSNPILADEFSEAKHAADSQSKFLRFSGRFPLTAVGDVNTYALFAEVIRSVLSTTGRAGVILPTGIATDDTTKEFFGSLMKNKSLAQLIGFENEASIFPDVHHAFKFCALTITGSESMVEHADFAFLCRRIEDVQQTERHFKLSFQDLSLLNPNTRTCPVFRTTTEAVLTKKIYSRVPVLENEFTQINPWGISFLRMLDMSNDSHLFADNSSDESLPLYEAKMFYHFDHRYSTYEGATQANLNAGILPQPTPEQKQNPSFTVLPRYWVTKSEVDSRLGNWKYNWLLGFRDITSNVVERTSIFSLMPKVGVGNSAPLLLPNVENVKLISCLLVNLNSIVFDYVTRQKIAGTHMNYFFVRQLPVLPPSAYSPADIDFITPRVLELVYTAHDLRPFAEDMGYHGEPFKWDESRRAQVRAELDAYYARLYGLTRDELRYILDPKEVHGADFPGETFRVLKDKEIKAYGEYRTSRLVLGAWDGQGQGGK